MGLGSAADQARTMCAVEPDDLPDAEDLWWSWVVLAALHRAVGDEPAASSPIRSLLALDCADGSWLRMQRPHGRRDRCSGVGRPWPRRPLPTHAAGRPTGHSPRRPRNRRPRSWPGTPTASGTLSAPHDEGAVHLLRPLLTVDPRVVELVRSGDATPESARVVRRRRPPRGGRRAGPPGARGRPEQRPRSRRVPAARPDPRPDARQLGDRPDADAATTRRWCSGRGSTGPACPSSTP